MKNLTSVAVLLTTFNSEPFLNQLLDSLLAQEFREWTLFISDDGSSDRTTEIIHCYEKSHPEKIFFIGFPEKNLGASLSFERLLRYVDSPYYMFCDHDDIWLPHKIGLSFSGMMAAESESPGIPVLIHTDLTVVDRELQVIDQSFSHFSRIDPVKFGNARFLSVANCVTGCTIMINQQARENLLPVPGRFVMYDWWIALNVVRSGKIIYLPAQTVLYRQHDQNVVGAKKAGLTFIAGSFVHFRRTLRADFNTIKAQRVFGDIGVIKYLYLKIIFQFKRYST